MLIVEFYRVNQARGTKTLVSGAFISASASRDQLEYNFSVD